MPHTAASPVSSAAIEELSPRRQSRPIKSKQNDGEQRHDDAGGFRLVEPLAETHDADANEHEHARHRADDARRREIHRLDEQYPKGGERAADQQAEEEPAISESPRLRNESPVAQNHFLIGTNLIYLGRPSDALTHLQAAEAYFQRAPIGGRRLLSSAMIMQGYAHLRMGALDSAANILTRALDEAGYEPGNASPDLKVLLRFGALIALEMQQSRRANELVSDLLAISTQSARDPALSADVGYALLLRARVRQALSEIAAAREDAHNAIAPLTAGLGADHPETLEARALLTQLI